MENRTSCEQHWALDPFLQVYFLPAALYAGACFLLGIVLNFVGFDEAAIPLPLRITGGVLAAIGAVSVLFLWLGMLSYWWQVYRRTHGTSWFWLGMLLLANWVGATIFYFSVFRRIAQRRIDENSL